ncbi:hypothetical protein [Marinobacter mangrovi]|uniref:hypothetical protein n=1 Tax=Marinobacter mangrovi TaxID=2803918 RepID=UPI0019314866|nr:hypothetical protein [Marinobacter mangrovi]
MDWGQALKIGGPATVAAFVFYKLISTYLIESKLIETNLIVNIVLLVFVFLFCLFLAWLLIPRKVKGDGSNKKDFVNNEIEENYSNSDINIGKQTGAFRGNKIKKNKSGGDINIG